MRTAEVYIDRSKAPPMLPDFQEAMVLQAGKSGRHGRTGRGSRQWYSWDQTLRHPVGPERRTRQRFTLGIGRNTKVLRCLVDLGKWNGATVQLVWNITEMWRRPVR